MSSPTSAPVIPAQPNQESYTTDALALFQIYTRDSYVAAFGVQAPAWDPSRVSKSWFDSTADISDAANVTLYKTAGTDASGSWILKQMVLPASEAFAVNLPGAITYPPYVVAPTAVTRAGAPVNPAYLSLEADARALMSALNGSGLVFEQGTTALPVIYPADEPRRLWDIMVSTNTFNAGLLLAQQNAQGLGYPGHWDTSSSDPKWIADPPAPTGVDDARPARPVPLRDLLPSEQLQTGPMGIGVMIVRTDLLALRLVQNGAFLPADRQTLQQIYDIVSKQS